MTHHHLINHIQLESDWVQQTVIALCRELQLRKRVRFIFEDTWTDIDEETGEVVTGTESTETIWEGAPWRGRERGIVNLRLPSAISFPILWDANGDLSGQSLSHVTCFRQPAELFLYLAARELRRVWQLEHPTKLERICQLLELDTEVDAEIHALRVLSRYRRFPADFSYSKGATKRAKSRRS